MLSVRRQSFVQLGLLLVPLALLPIAVTHGALPASSDPALGLLGMLVVLVGLPLFVVCTASPVLQRWFSESGDAASRDPYFLYAASNAGSFLGLLAYPTLLEPQLTLAQQSQVWTVAYAVFAVLTALCALRLLAAPRGRGGRGTASARGFAHVAPPAALDRACCAALEPHARVRRATSRRTSARSRCCGFCRSPRIWSASCSRSRAGRSCRSRSSAGRSRSRSTLVVLSILGRGAPDLGCWSIVHIVNLFLVSLLVHRRLALERPSTQHLTEYYLLLSVGGVCGGILTALVAPVVFTTILEYPIAIVAALLLRPHLARRVLATSAGGRSSDARCRSAPGWSSR